jgi:hypothetical protein
MDTNERPTRKPAKILERIGIVITVCALMYWVFKLIVSMI